MADDSSGTRGGAGGLSERGQHAAAARSEGDTEGAPPSRRPHLSEHEGSAPKRGGGQKKGGKPRARRLRLGGRKHESWETRVSKTITSLLRHRAGDFGLDMAEDGYVRVDELLELLQRIGGIDLPLLQHIVEVDVKQRFSLVDDASRGGLLIRANQGHSLKGLDEASLLTEVTRAEEAPVCVHGTTRAAWESIKESGLSPMKRTHVHFAAGVPGASEVISGMRRSSEVLVFLDVPRALASGLKLWRSQNNVLLTAHVAPSLFSQVIDAKTREVLLDVRSGAAAVDRCEAKEEETPGGAHAAEASGGAGTARGAT